MLSETASEQARTSARALGAGCVNIVTEDELIAKLSRAEAERRPLRVKLGIDASGPDIHLGFAVVLHKLRQFQDYGHTAVLIVGDFTGKIGDPSGRSKTRPQLSDDEIRLNMARYQEQAYKILKPERAEIAFNSHWSNPLTAREIIELASKITVARIIEREDFRRRLAEGLPLGLHEILYPLFQGYDSVAVRADIELGGQDQYWNLLVGRELQRGCDQEPQVIMTVPLLEGLDGKLKMSKSYGNYVGIAEPARGMYGKIMSLPDSAIGRYFELAAGWPSERLAEVEAGLRQGDNPRDWKDRLARAIVARYHSETEAEQAAAEFDQVFRQHRPPDKMPDYVLTGRQPLVDVVVGTGLLPSKSEARRKIAEGAVYLDGVRVADIALELEPARPVVLKVGKRRFCRIVPVNADGRNHR
jgi:tyrosyl-tRNA synthetase